MIETQKKQKTQVKIIVMVYCTKGLNFFVYFIFKTIVI